MLSYYIILLRWHYYKWQSERLLRILDQRSAIAYRTSDPVKGKAYDNWLTHHQRKMDVTNSWFGFYTYLRRAPHQLLAEGEPPFFKKAHFEELWWLARRLGVLYYRDEEHLLEQIAERQRLLTERTWQFTLMIIAVMVTAFATKACG